jgi:hypothetical protein
VSFSAEVATAQLLRATTAEQDAAPTVWQQENVHSSHRA